MAGPVAPPLIATIGLHASASTWVFNVVRELMIDAVGETQVLSLYGDEAAQMPDAAVRAGRHLVVKSHHGSAGLDDWLAAEQARIFLSMRDPRDACVSMALRFKAPLNNTARWIANDCSRLLRLADQGHPLLRYEDRFFEHRDTIARIAVTLGLQPSAPTIETFHTRYSTDAVRAFARNLDELPPERLTTVVTFKMDRVTQILGPHIGDATSGKWRALPRPTQTELTRMFTPFLCRFDYPL